MGRSSPWLPGRQGFVSFRDSNTSNSEAHSDELQRTEETVEEQLSPEGQNESFTAKTQYSAQGALWVDESQSTTTAGEPKVPFVSLPL